MLMMFQRLMIGLLILWFMLPAWSQPETDVRTEQSGSKMRLMEARPAPRSAQAQLQASCGGTHADSAACIRRSVETCRQRGGQERLTHRVTDQGEVSGRVNCHSAAAPSVSAKRQFAAPESAQASCLQGTICSCNGTAHPGPDSVYSCTAQMLSNCVSSGGIINHLGYNGDGAGGSTGYVQCLSPY